VEWSHLNILSVRLLRPQSPAAARARDLPPISHSHPGAPPDRDGGGGGRQDAVACKCGSTTRRRRAKPASRRRPSSAGRHGSTPSTRSVRSRVLWIASDFLRNLISQGTDRHLGDRRTFPLWFQFRAPGVVFLGPHALAAQAPPPLAFSALGWRRYTPPSRIGTGSPRALSLAPRGCVL
jgi:hypothetical protein